MNNFSTVIFVTFFIAMVPFFFWIVKSGQFTQVFPTHPWISPYYKIHPHINATTLEPFPVSLAGFPPSLYFSPHSDL